MNPSSKTRARGAWRAGRRLPLLLFGAAALFAVFLAGIYVEAAGIFPSTLIRSAHKTLMVNLGAHGLSEPTNGNRSQAQSARRSAECAEVAASVRQRLKKQLGMRMVRCASARIAPADAAAARIDFLAGEALADAVLMKGEVGAFLDHCPAPWGCLAVEYARSGAVHRAWPFRPDEIVEANTAVESDYPYEHAVGWAFTRGMATFHLSPYPRGDLLVVFEFADSHPTGGGVARVAPDGRPRWYRKDYSHHWPHVVGEDLALVPGMHMRRDRLAFQIREGNPRSAVRLECRNGLINEDLVNVFDGAGELLEEISILDAIIASPYAGSLSGAADCDPTHINFAHMLGADAGGAAGIAPGDLVVSLRGLSAFGILDKDDRRLKRLVRGSFLEQHGVRHLDKARFAMFDNLGTDGVHGPSRLLVVDLATGEETTVFPNDATPKHLRGWFTRNWGQFDLSADGRRALVADVQGGRAFEIRLADGAVLNVFRQVHDLSTLTALVEAETLTKNAWLFRFQGIHYGKGWVP